MPPRTKKFSATTANTKKSKDLDDFVVDDNAGEDDAPSTKKRKLANTSGATDAEAVKSNVIGKEYKDDDGNAYFEIGGRLRRATISTFKGTNFINIREYYEKDGKILPGKKGIALNIEQMNNLIQILPNIEKILRDKGEILERPEYEEDEIDKEVKRRRSESRERESEKEEEDEGERKDEVEEKDKEGEEEKQKKTRKEAKKKEAREEEEDWILS